MGYRRSSSGNPERSQKIEIKGRKEPTGPATRSEHEPIIGCETQGPWTGTQSHGWDELPLPATGEVAESG